MGGADGGTPPSGDVGVTNRAGAADGVFVKTYDAAGATLDRGFHVAAFC